MVWPYGPLKAMNMIALLFAILVSGYAFVQGQDPPNVPQLLLTRENVEAILETLSRRNPACQAEMEAALGSQTEVSGDCKIEIQTVLVELDIPIVPPTEAELRANANIPRADFRTKKAAPAGILSPFYLLGGFLVVLFGSIVGYIVFVNSSRGDALTKPSKKLSKKKEEKMRNKGKKL